MAFLLTQSWNSKKQLMKDYLSEMKEGVSIAHYIFLHRINMSQTEYILCVQAGLKHNKIFLKRSPDEIRSMLTILQLLSVWQAYMDIQFVLIHGLLYTAGNVWTNQTEIPVQEACAYLLQSPFRMSSRSFIFINSAK